MSLVGCSTEQADRQTHLGEEKKKRKKEAVSVSNLSLDLQHPIQNSRVRRKRQKLCSSER